MEHTRAWTMAAVFTCVIAIWQPQHADAQGTDANLPPFKEPRSARFDIAGSVGIKGTSIMFPFTGSGVISGGSVEEELIQSMPEDQEPAEPSGAPGKRVLSVVLAGSNGYVRVSGHSPGTDGRWYRMDLTEGWEGKHTLPGLRGSNLTGPDPVYASAFQTTRVGKEVISGTSATKYRSNLDVGKLHNLKKIPPSWAQSYGAEDPSRDQMTLFTWVGDADRYIRREQLIVEVEAYDPGSTPGTKVKLGTVQLIATVDYHDFDVPVTITEPSGAQSFDLDAGYSPNGYHPSEPSSSGLMPGFPLSVALVPVNPFLVQQGLAMPPTGRGAEGLGQQTLLAFLVASACILAGALISKRNLRAGCCRK